jgi:hypothetical protein
MNTQTSLGTIMWAKKNSSTGKRDHFSIKLKPDFELPETVTPTISKEYTNQ